MIEFVIRRRPASLPRTSLVTVAFTDIVDSTAQEASVGDQSWHTILDSHDRRAHEL
jgi:hypothetical protein